VIGQFRLHALGGIIEHLGDRGVMAFFRLAELGRLTAIPPVSESNVKAIIATQALVR
jgi:hypothetical protein